MKKNKQHFIATPVITLFFLCACFSILLPARCTGDTLHVTAQDKYTLIGKKHLANDFPAFANSGNIMVVVEIPTGTNAKWEVDKATGGLKREFKKGKPRTVAYLGYPGNYGMIPRTILSEKSGGDGDPLDVLLLGPALPRGTVIEARAIGVLKLLDDGEQDDKIIAVLPGSKLGKISSIKKLDKKFKGITDIIEIWFSNYKGPGRITSQGYRGPEKARKIIKQASKAYKKEPMRAK